MFWNIIRIYIFSFLPCKTLRAIVTLFFSKFFQSFFSDGKFIPCQLHLFIKGLIFIILCRSLFISSWFNMTVTAYWKQLLYFLLMGFIVVFLFFIQSGESTYDSPQLGFILHKPNTLHQFQIILISIFKWIKKLFYNFICFVINHDFYVITFSVHYMFFIIIYRRNKVICYC